MMLECPLCHRKFKVHSYIVKEAKIRKGEILCPYCGQVVKRF